MRRQSTIGNDIQEYDARHEETNDFYTKDIQSILDASDGELFSIIVNALKAGYARGYRRAEQNIGA